MPGIYRQFSAISNKDSLVNLVKDALLTQGWTIESVQPAGQWITVQFPAALNSGWPFQQVSINGGATGIVFVFDGDEGSFVPESHQRRFSDGNPETLRSLVAGAIAELGGVGNRFTPGTFEFQAAGSGQTSYIVNYEVIGGSSSGHFDIQTPTVTETNNLIIGSALRQSWGIPQFGGHFCTCQALHHATNKFSCFVNNGGPATGSNYPLFYICPPQAKDRHPGYFKPVFSSNNYGFPGHASNWKFFYSPYNLWALALTASAGLKPALYASCLHQAHNINQSVILGGSSFGGGFRDANTCNGLWLGKNSNYFLESESLFFSIPYLRRFVQSESIRKAWNYQGGLATQYSEPYIIYRANSSGADYFLLGQIKDAVIACNSYTLDNVVTFDGGRDYIPFNPGPNTLMLEAENL